MSKLSFSEAAKQGFASRPTLYRKWKTGELSVEAADAGPLVDVSELVRVFGEPGKAVTRRPGKKESDSRYKAVKRETETEAETAERYRIETETLRAELAAARENLERERAAAERERQNADRLLALLEQSQRQLTDQRTKSGGFFRRLFGKDGD